MFLTPEVIRSSRRRQSMIDATSIATRYIALWNETDPGHRKALMADLWSEAGTYRDPLMQGDGHDQIDALIAGVHKQFPDFRFALVGQPDGYDDQVRFSWQLGPEGSDGPIKGADFVTLERGRLKSVVGFLDQVPTAPLH
jgi:hypothetical protein